MVKTIGPWFTKKHKEELKKLFNLLEWEIIISKDSFKVDVPTDELWIWQMFSDSDMV